MLGAVATIATTGDSLVTGYRAGLALAAGVVAVSILMVRRLPAVETVVENVEGARLTRSSRRTIRHMIGESRQRHH